MMLRSLAFASAVMAALCSCADGSIELHDGEDLAGTVADEAAYDEIILHKGTYPITSTVVVDRKMTIRGADGTTPDEVVLDGDNKRRLVNLTSGSAGSLISGVTLTRGKVKGAYEEWISGAAVLMQTASILSNCVISANTLEDRGRQGSSTCKRMDAFCRTVS